MKTIALRATLVVLFAQCIPLALADLPAPRLIDGKCTDKADLQRILRERGVNVDPPKITPEGFAAAWADKGKLRVEDITDKLARRTAGQSAYKGRSVTYSELVGYYESNLSIFSQLYSDVHFKPVTGTALGQYPGTRRLEMGETHRLPFLPVSLELEESADLRLFKLVVDYGGRKISGLRARYSFKRPARQQCPDTMLLMYMPTVNARVLGFTHAQLIPELSENVTANDFYWYNDVRDWSTHDRLKKEDQLTKPVGLTNFAHAGVNNGFFVSALPDFALDLHDFNKPYSRFTFFLWRAGERSSGEMEGKNRVPDFVYEIELAFQGA